jgi:hypothetical protein
MTMLLIIVTVLLSSRLSNWWQQSILLIIILMVLIKSFKNVIFIGLQTVILAWGLNLKAGLTIWSLITILTLQYLIKSQSHFSLFYWYRNVIVESGLISILTNINIQNCLVQNCVKIASSFSLHTCVTLTSIWPIRMSESHKDRLSL